VEAGILGHEIPVQTLTKRRRITKKGRSSFTHVSLLSSIIEPLLPSTETVTRPRLAAREDLEAAANSEKNKQHDMQQQLTHL
jgi:hypothetical protein